MLVVLMLLVPASLPAATIPQITAPPFGERWFSVNLGDERVGFAHMNIQPREGGYQISSDSSVKMVVMGFSREASSKESYLVGPDLTLKSFAVEQRIDGSPLQVKGEVNPKGIKVVVESAGGRKERTLNTKGPVYPPQALNLYPLLRGAAPGKKYRVSILDVEAVKVKEVKVEVVGQESLPNGIPTTHLKNDLFTMVDNDIWVDLKGNTIKESVREDLVVTLAEEEQRAKSILTDEVLAKKDMVLDFSLIKVAPPITGADRLKKLVVDFAGIPQALPLLQGPRQQGVRLADGKVRFTMPAPTEAQVAQVATGATGAADLEPSARIPSDDPAIIAQKQAILGKQKDPTLAAKLLVAWVAKEVKGTVTDSQSPLETLKNRDGNCQSHARLYAALARAAQIPTRFVSGIVYAPGQGFLYHSWAESYLGQTWLPVDPTFGEVPANLTHIKLVEGDTPDDMGQLAAVIGRLRGAVIEQQY